MSRRLEHPVLLHIDQDVQPLGFTDVSDGWEQHTYQAPNGRRKVDKTVRDCLVYTEAWSSAVAEIDRLTMLKMSGAHMIVEQNLLRYEPGSHCSVHTDRERKKHGMEHIGTIVVQGGEFEGGELRVGGRKAMRGKDNVYFIPLGKEHSVDPVEKGTREVVTFAAYKQKPSAAAAAPRSTSRASFRHKILGRKD